jgi:ABC-type branched-subunit amino acid transport system substrate-binding protein
VTKDTVSIGVTTAASGALASACGAIINGYQSEFSAINARGGVNGRKINVTQLDDANDATKAVANVTQLMEQPVFAFFGECGTTPAAAIAPILNQAQVPFLFSYAAAESLYNPPLKYVYVVNPAYATQILTMFKYAETAVPGKQAVGLVASKIAGYEDVVSASKGYAAQKGYDWVGEFLTNTGTADYTPTAIQVKEANPALLLVQLSVTDGARLMQALAVQNFFPKLTTAGATLATDGFVAAGGGVVGSRIAMASPIQAGASLDPSARCVQDMQQANVAIDQLSLWGCGTAEMLRASIEAAGPEPTRDSLIAALDKMNNAKLSDIFPPVSFSPTNHLALQSLYVATIQDNKIVTAKDPAPILQR